ncbi:hypothetical protein, partial [Methylobacterium crusticola]
MNTHSPILPPAAEPVERIALLNYATWLFYERRLLCAELYPHLGSGAERFILGENVAWDWHFREPGHRHLPQPSTRAVTVLDMVGVNWREDRDRLRDADREPVDLPDTVERPALPRSWPRVDAEVLDAASDLNNLDAAQQALLNDGEYGDAVDAPGYSELERQRDAAIKRVASARARSILGLSAKARLLQTDSVGSCAEPFDLIARSLADDLAGVEGRYFSHAPDPILAVLAA